MAPRFAAGGAAMARLKSMTCLEYYAMVFRLHLHDLDGPCVRRCRGPDARSDKIAAAPVDKPRANSGRVASNQAASSRDRRYFDRYLHVCQLAQTFFDCVSIFNIQVRFLEDNQITRFHCEITRVRGLRVRRLYQGSR